MENNSWIEYKINVRERLKVFALNIIDLSDKLPKSTRINIINNQVTRSGTSTYANYRASLRGREMWLDLLIASKIYDTDFIKTLHAESLELVKILSSMRKRTEGD